MTTQRPSAVESGEIDLRLGHQTHQPSGAIPLLDKIARSEFEQPKAGPKGKGQDTRSNMKWGVPSRYGLFSW